MSGAVPDVPVRSARRSLRERVSIVWLVPLAALLIALGVAWQSYADRGPLIRIAFADAAGIAAGETELRYRDVAVGLVEEVGFSENLEEVIVAVRLDKAVADYVDAGAEFWVVRPEVTTQGVSGLDTVLSGVYLQGLWDAEADGLRTRFDGLGDAPLVPVGQDGLRLVLTSTTGSLSSQTPLLYKGVEVGRIGRAEVSGDGLSVTADAVVLAPYDRLVTDQTRFWDTSGFTLSIGPNGAAVDFQSIASLISGGVTFDTLVSGGVPVADGQRFEVYGDEATARNSIFNRPDGPDLNLTAIFDGNVSGLTVGSPVELNGLRIGEVSNLSGIVDADRFGDGRVRLLAVLAVRPARLGLDGAAGVDEALAFLQRQAARGLRARLVTGSLLTGGLKVQLTAVPDAPPEAIDMAAEPFPRFPATASDITDVTATAQGTLDRINDLPIEELLQSAVAFLDNASGLIGSEDLQRSPTELRGLLAELRGVVGSQDVQALPEQAGALMAGLRDAVAEVQAILAEVERQDAVTRVLSSFDAVEVAAGDVGASLGGVPDLVQQIDTVAQQVATLPLPELVEQVNGLVAAAEAVIGTDAARQLPAGIASLVAELDVAVGQARGVLGQVEDEGGVTRLLAAVDGAQAAATQLDLALAGVPQLVARIDAVAATAQDLPLETLVAELTALLSSADALVDSDDTRALPGQLNAALDELRQVLADLREGGAVANVNATLAAARDAADRIALATEGLPGLVERAGALIGQANATLAGFEDTSPVLRDARSALREVTLAAEAVASFARALERRPNSLLIGR